MREDNFKQWLAQQEYASSTISTQLTSARTIEQVYGDLDELYDRDAFAGLADEFTYSAADRTANRPNPTKLKLWGDTYRDLAHHRATLNYYKRFRQGVARIRKGLPLPNRLSVERAMDEYVEVGATIFMESYGFSWNNVRHYALHNELEFPAKAIFAVSYQFMPSGAALNNKDCDGTEAHEHLASLGFKILIREPIMLFDAVGDSYEPVAQTNSATGRKAFRFKRKGASNRSEDAVETNDLGELSRILFIDGLAVRISSSNGGTANYLTYPGQTFTDYWLRPDLAEAITKKSKSDTASQSTEEIVIGQPTNVILYGPPGTGKTWRTAYEAVRLCDALAPSNREALMARYRALEAQKRIAFVTFHQSLDYESFVEGLRPETDGSDAEEAGFHLEPRPGMFREICSLADQARRTRGKARLDPVELGGRTFWKMGLGAIGTDDNVFENSINGGYIVLGWGGNQDWSDPRFESAAEIEKTWKAKESEDRSPSNYAQLWLFRSKMKKGDIVIVPFGNSAFRAVAEVIGEYQYVPGEDGHYNHRRQVNWLLTLADPLPLETIIEGKFSMRTLYTIPDNRLNKSALNRLFTDDEPVSVGAPEQFVLIIDEINRANVSKVFGELITLIEPDKRLGQPNALEVMLPYSRKPFGVPDNLHIVGTMNTADRSIALLDTALRRRFTFVEVAPDPHLLAAAVSRSGMPLIEVLTTINDRIEYLLDREHRIGHAFFVDCTTRQDVDRAMREKIIPLLQEYFFEDWGRVAAVLGEETRPAARLHRGAFLTCKRLKDPTGSGGVDRLSWSVIADDAGGFSEDAYEQLIQGSPGEIALSTSDEIDP